MLLIRHNCYSETILLMNVAGLLWILVQGEQRGVQYGAMVDSSLSGRTGGWRGRRQVDRTVRGTRTLLLVRKPNVVRSPTALPVLRPAGDLSASCFGGRCALLHPPVAGHGQSFLSVPLELVRRRSGPHRDEPLPPCDGGFAYGVRSLVTFVEGPLLLAFRADNYDGEFGWQLLVIAGLAVMTLVSGVCRHRRGYVLWPAAVSLWLYGFWFFTAQQARFAVPAVLAFVLISAEGMRLVHGRRRALVLWSLLLTTVVSIPWRRHGYYQYTPLPRPEG